MEKFVYEGIEFAPFRNFTEAESDRIWEFIIGDMSLGIDVDYEAFYAAAKAADAEVDIFEVYGEYICLVGSSVKKMQPEGVPEHRIRYRTATVEHEEDEDNGDVAELLPAISDEGIKDFYPTPKSVASVMVDGFYDDNSFFYRTSDRMRKIFASHWQPLRKKRIETILEPSAGRGDLAHWLKEKYGRDKVDCIELNEDLRATLKGKGFRVIHDDFLTFRPELFYDLIVMNPPFSDAVNHVKKAMEIQRRNGGLLIALVNAETIRNPYTRARQELLAELAEQDAEIAFIEDGFANAARPTDVEVAVIKVALPEPEMHESDIYSRLTQDEKWDTESMDEESTALLPGDEVQQLVQGYNLEIKAGLALYREYKALAPHIMEDFEDERRRCAEEGSHVNSAAMLKLTPEDPNEYINAVRAKYWKYALRSKIFDRLTSDLQQEWNRRLDKLKYYDFTAFNIRSVLLEMMQQMATGVQDAILDYFDQFTRYAMYDGTENVHYYNGWRTNSAYKVNKKVILPCYGAINDRDWSSDYGKLDVYAATQKLSDIEKVFAYLDDGTVPDATVLNDVGYSMQRVTLAGALQWAYQNGRTRKIQTKYFEVSFFKKGTMHIVFTEPRLLDAFNIYGARKRNWLPETYGVKSYEDMDAEEKAVIDSFQGEDAYRQVMADKQFYLQEPEKAVLALGA